ncbi:TRAP transporter small permease [Desulfothermus okinawensis JCM 13304]
MDRILKTIDFISKLGAYISGFFMLLIVFLISLEIFLRTFFKTSTMVSDEFSAYFMVFSVFLGLAYTLKEGKHIKITLITSRIKNKKVAKALDLVVFTLAFAISIYALYYSIMMVYETYSLDMRADSMLETPLWIPEMGVPLGFLLLCSQLFSMIIRRLKNYQ